MKTMPHILVLDDEADHLEAIRRAFGGSKEHRHRFKLEIVETVRAAKASVRRQTPEIAIIDWKLTDGSGVELLPGYGRPAPYPVILMTSYGSVDAEVDALSKGAVDYIQKDLPNFRRLPELCVHVLRFWRHLQRERQIDASGLDRAHRLSDLGMVAAGMVHDLNNKLTSIKRGSELALEDAKAGHLTKTTIPLLETVLDSAKKSQTLTKRLLNNSVQGHRKCVFDLPAQLESISRTLRSVISGAVEIDYTVGKINDRNVNVDPLELELVLTNLVKNAEESIGNRAGKVTIHLDEIGCSGPDSETGLPQGSYLRTNITDSGQGIAKDKLPHIFDPFFTTKVHGTGLGLARAKAFLEFNGGEIIVHSKWGEGATFSLFLPVSGETPLELPAQTDLPMSVLGHDEFVVVVDDQVPLLPGLAVRLERWKYRVLTFSDSEKAYQYLIKNAEQVSLVITDYLMPGLTGIDLRRRLLASGIRMPRMILMTGRQDQMPAHKAEREGFDDYVEKPGDDSELSRKIRQVLDRREN